MRNGSAREGVGVSQLEARRSAPCKTRCEAMDHGTGKSTWRAALSCVRNEGTLRTTGIWGL